MPSSDGWSWPKVALVCVGGLMIARSLGGNFDKAATSVTNDVAKAGAAVGAGVGVGKAAAALGSAGASRIAAGGQKASPAAEKPATEKPAAPKQATPKAAAEQLCTTDVPLGGINMKIPTQCPKAPGQTPKSSDKDLADPVFTEKK